jgi:hypothetical protein
MTIHDAPAFFFGREIAVTKAEKRLKKMQRMQKDLDWLYTTARDSGEREAISFVEDIVDNWVDAELKLSKEEK